MKTSDFDYELPPELIAQQPAAQRDQARMLVLNRASGNMEHRRFHELPSYLTAGDVMVLNNTRVIPARVFATKESGGRVELLMLEELEKDTWDVLLRASRRPAVGATLRLTEDGVTATLLEDGERGRAKVRFHSTRPVLEVLEEIGLPPLPPYIGRKDKGSDDQASDRERYQTLFAQEPGAVAAPTAGLHFTPEVMKAIQDKDVRRAEVTLHVGLGTFRPVTADRVEDHEMEDERYAIPASTAETIQQAKADGGSILAVGSTSVRTLETVAGEHGEVVAGSGRSRLFIYPPYDFRVVDRMLTNFHLPKSTLLMMISAFAGRDLIRQAYEEAVRERYRFYSYGDCMLIL